MGLMLLISARTGMGSARLEPISTRAWEAGLRPGALDQLIPEAEDPARRCLQKAGVPLGPVSR
jgi:hypothetical protein